MIIPNQKVEVGAGGANKQYYESLGYIANDRGYFEVEIKDLRKGSHSKILVMCDYCFESGKENIIEKVYKNYHIEKNKNKYEKDCCWNCKPKKAKETCLNRYGVDHASKLENTVNKRNETNLIRYGHISPLKNKDIINKSIHTSLKRYGKNFYMQTEEYKSDLLKTNNEKYGCDFLFQTKDFKEEMKRINREKYGVEYVSQRGEIQEKIKSNNMIKYGVEHLMHNPEYSKEIMKKIRMSLFENNTFPSSSQQRYIHEIVGGTINNLVDRFFLDVALIDEMIYIEYDGSGHDLSIKLGAISEKEFMKREISRQYFLKNAGWKLIRIRSKNDFLPTNQILKNMVGKAREIFMNGRSWVVYDIDKGSLEFRKNVEFFDFGELIKI
jgi:hypothetical protein